jgi:hypothetical protein
LAKPPLSSNFPQKHFDHKLHGEKLRRLALTS